MRGGSITLKKKKEYFEHEMIISNLSLFMLSPS